MSLSHAILAALLDGEASGYDLAKRFDASVANFWPATRQQLYRELESLQQAQLVRFKTVRQKNRPDKRVFRLSAAGRKELHAFIERGPRGSATRDELLVQVQGAVDADAGPLLESLRIRLDASRTKLALYEKMRLHLLDGRDEQDYLLHAERAGPYLTLLRGISFEKENARWCLRCIAVVTARM